MSRFLKCAGISALPLMTICLFGPLLIYSGNPEEFTASYVELILVFLPYACVISCLFGLSGVIMTESASQRFIAIMSAVAVLLWLQGNILVWDYGPLDGHSINWLLGVWRGVLDTAIWIVLIGLAITATERLSRLLLHAAVGTMLIQFVAAGFLLMSGGELSLTRSGVEENAQAKQEILRFSKSTNVLHIVMDGFQTDIFKEIVEDPKNQSYKEQLQGFTLFENNVGPYPYTQMTVPAILTGKLYRNEVPADEFIDSALRGRTILGSAAEAGFDVDIAAPVALKNTYAKSRHTNAYGISSSDHVSSRHLIDSDATRLIDLALFRAAPHFVKPLIYREDLWLFQAAGDARSFLHIQYFSDLAFIAQLTERLTVDRDEPVYKMMHLMLSHRPTVGNEKCEYDGRRRTNRENVTLQAGCGLNAVLGLLGRLQELGIYENSLIILMADHGAWVPVDGLDPMGEGAVIDPVRVAMATPMLAIKRPGATHPYRVSVAPTAIVDVAPTIADTLQLGGSFNGRPVFDIDDTDLRKRRHYSYEYGENTEQPGYLWDLQEFVTDGSPFELSSWRRGRNYRPKGRIEPPDPVD